MSTDAEGLPLQEGEIIPAVRSVAEGPLRRILIRVTAPRLAHVLAVLAVVLAAGTRASASLWVSPEGDDAGPGTEEHPLRTIGRARDLVRTLDRDMADDVTVFISGTQVISSPLEFGPQDSGTNGYSVIYTAAPGSHPVVSAARRVTGWSVADRSRNLWSAPLPEGLAAAGSLFVDGSPASRTRIRLPQRTDRSPTPTPTSDPRAQLRNPADVALLGRDADAVWSGAVGTPPFYAENAFEALGTPGEWYFDRPARRIYYVPRPGEDLVKADAEACAPTSLVIGAGTAGRPLAGLVFKGITFECAGAAATGDAAVDVSRAAYVQFLEDAFLHIDGPAVRLGPGIRGATVEGCLFRDISQTPLAAVDASEVSVSECRFSYVATADPLGCAIALRRSGASTLDHVQMDHYPDCAVLEDGRPFDAAGHANLVSPPMDGRPLADAALPQPDAGVSSAYSGILAARPMAVTPPHPAGNVCADPENGFAYVTWDPPCLDGGAPVTGYTVTSSGGAVLKVTQAEFLARGYAVFDDLEDGTPVTFVVVAANAAGSGPPSHPSAPIVPQRRRRLKAPQAPTGVSAAATPGGLRVQWAPPADTGGSPIVAYSVTASVSGRRVLIEGRDVIHPDASRPVVRTLPGFVLGAGESVLVAAVNARGQGAAATVGAGR
jgi:hypothetical protein